ncbi:hypothetical protein I3842_14G034300 [Carya illinoinensis]|uniref:PGG domain-containing protein n=1 Tax=Carya illinoinensis TaxID=32201 RepID=A0A922A9Y7_CARIL|nr:hypothetical protein I3842_14G034300 [Carya illinoinensis]
MTEHWDDKELCKLSKLYNDKELCKLSKLYNAVRGGNLDETKAILGSLPHDAVNWEIPDKGETALHTAVRYGHEHIVEALVMQMSNQSLAMYNSDGFTALTMAVLFGKRQMVECMLRKYSDLISIRHSIGKNLPVVMAIDFRQIEMARHLYYLTPETDLIPKDNDQEIQKCNGATLLTHAIYSGTLDITLDLIRRYPRLVLALDKCDESPVLALASTRHSVPGAIQLGFWKQCIYSCMRIPSMPPLTSNETRLDVSNGEQYQSNQEDQNIISVMSRSCAVGVLNFFGKMEHPARVTQISGAALQMQRELQWFKEVERIVHPRDKESINNDGFTPQQLFTKNHKNMMKEGEKWMKDTSKSCMVVGALIVTIMFQVAFTIPCGNNQDTGLCRVFMISDTLSLFSSSTSVLMFLGILTSRYTEDDFLKYLPRQMIIGLSTLFCSIATMMITFASALLIILQEQSRMPIPLICLGGVPVILFLWIRFPILKDMIISTYGPSIFDRKMKLKL